VFRTLIIPIENPFFTREIRQLSRRGLPALFGGLGCITFPAVVLLIVALVQLLSARRPDPQDDLLALLVLPHVAVCGSAGYYGGDRVFRTEHRRSTLEGVLLLPYPARQLLALKLALPLFLVAVAWGAGIPLYLMAVYLGTLQPSRFAETALLPLFLGLWVLCGVLVAPPDSGSDAEKARRASDPTHLDRRSRISLLAPLAYLGFLMTMAVISSRAPGLPFFSGRAPASLFYVSGTFVLVIAAGSTALVTVQRSPLSEWWASIARLVASIVVMGLVAGILWRAIPFAYRAWVPLVLAGIVLADFWYRRVRREDRLAPAEVRWIASRWENPVLVRDLCVYTRYASIRRSLVGGLLVSAACGALVVYLLNEYPGLIQGIAGLLFILAYTTASQASTRASSQWTREESAKTLSQLLVTSLRSSELVRGRALAACVYWGAQSAPAIALLAPLIWEANRRFVWTGPLMLAVSPLPLFSVFSTGPLKADDVSPHFLLGTLQLIVVPWVCFHPVILRWGLEPSALWGAALTAFALNSSLAWLRYRVRVVQLDRLRRAGVEENLTPELPSLQKKGT
jgi:hypothetical protein